MCFSRKPKTSQGVKIDRRKIPGLPSDEDHSKALDIFITECVKHFDYSKVQDIVKLVTIEWWNDIAPSPSTGKLNTVVVHNGQVYSGLTVSTTLCKVAWRGKIHRSAFVHEFLHIVNWSILGDSDPNHTNDVLRSLEVAINAKLSEINL
jgi:hypothetical protein